MSPRPPRADAGPSLQLPLLPPESKPASHPPVPDPAEELVEFRGIGELLAWFGILPARGREGGREEAARRAEGLLRRLGPWRWRRGFRVPRAVLDALADRNA